GVDHVGLKVPPDSQVQRQPSRRAPIILQVGPELCIGAFDTRRTSSIAQLVGSSVIERQRSRVGGRTVGDGIDELGVLEQWGLIVAFVDLVFQEMDPAATFKHVLSDTVVGEVVANADAPWMKF